MGWGHLCSVCPHLLQTLQRESGPASIYLSKLYHTPAALAPLVTILPVILSPLTISVADPAVLPCWIALCFISGTLPSQPRYVGISHIDCWEVMRIRFRITKHSKNRTDVIVIQTVLLNLMIKQLCCQCSCFSHLLLFQQTRKQT